MGGEGRKRGEESSIPPRKLNVQKFAESRGRELEALQTIVSERLNNDFRSIRNKRRRTSAFHNQSAKKRNIKKRRKLDKINGNGGDKEKEKEMVNPPPRHIRRRTELKKNPKSGFSTSGDGTKRLRTHLWHAKRFAMTKLWGFHLPLHFQGRGRGCRALLKWYKHGAVIHDASYYSVVQLEGPQDSLMPVLKMVLEPSPSAQSDQINNAIRSGAIYGSAMLHHDGAPVSQLIAPVTYMWRPFNLCNGDNGGGDDCSSSHRQLWVWIHASAFNEGFDALKLACQKQMNESGILINCLSLEGQLAKLEVMGLKTFQLLQKILQTDSDSCYFRNSWQPKKCAVEEADDDSEFNKSSIIEKEMNISPCAVLPFTVRDPREMPEKRIGNVPVAAPTVENCVSENEPGKDVTVCGDSENFRGLNSPSCSKPVGDNSFFDKGNLWDASSRATSPVEENALCLEKHHLRMDSFCLNDPKSEMLGSSTEVQGSRSCPIMLLKNNNQMGSSVGWSIIIPVSWVRVFWISFISKGAHAIGVQEKRWIACEVGLPVFPSDFPDSNAYSSSMETARIATDQKAERLPPAVRPFKLPIPPPWNSVRAAVDKGCISLHMTDCNSLSNPRCGDNGISFSLRNDSSNLFEGFVARTTGVLINFLKDINGVQLLLFPLGKTGFIESMKDESKPGRIQIGITQITCDRKLCFVRVLLHVHKKGVFEEGAVICAPHLSDLSLWTSRSEKREVGFQIPQSSVISYFKEQGSGKWELQLPGDLAARESHRWPIGFVTTGFVQGSKKAGANAYCEAVLLAQLREEQWNAFPVKQRRKEIYVLVRNLRSSAYRVGLASVVLEQKEEDVEFL